MKASLFFALLLAAGGCNNDACAPFDGKTCIALEVLTSSKTPLLVDQLGISIDDVLVEVLTPNPARRSAVALPVFVAVLPGDPPPASPLNVNVRGLRQGQTVAAAMGTTMQLLRGQHLAAAITLNGPDGPQNDLIGADFSGVDFSGVDMAGADLSHTSGTAFAPANGGLFGGDVQVLLADFANGGVYAGSGGGGVFKSSDSGSNWVAANNGLDIPFVTAMARDNITGAIYVGGSRPDGTGGLFRSTDAGSHWTKLVDHIVQAILATTDSLANPVILIGAPDGILRSEDNGVSFTAINTGLTDLSVASLVDDPLNKGTIEAATFATKVFQSTDFGDHWNDISTGLPAIGQNGARELRLDPHTRDLVLSTSSGLFERALGSASFTAYSPAPPSGFSSTAMEFSESSSPDLYVAGFAGVFHLDGAKTQWTNVSSGLVDHDLFAITVDLSNPSLLYGAGFSGVYVSTNSGSSWSLSNKGISNLSMFRLAIDPKTPSTLYGGSQRNGVMKSVNGGTSWAPVNNGLSPNIGLSAIAVDPEKPSTVFISTQDNNGTGVGAVLRSTDSGGTWNQVDASPSTVLLVDPSNSSIVFAGGVSSGPLLRRSTDGGQSFTGFGTGLADLAYTLAIDPTNSQIMYAATLRNAVFKSTNAGATWSAASTGITETQINSLAIDPHQPTHLWASGFQSVYRSTDAGASWIPSPTGLSGNIGFNVIAVNSTGTVYTSGTGIFRSDDGGATWSRLDAAPLLTVYDIAVDPKNADTLYFAYLGAPSVLKTTTGGR